MFTKLWYNKTIKMEVPRMDNQEYACYEVKLNRIFNIQSKQDFIWLAVLFALLIFYTILNLVNHTFNWIGLLLFCCGCLAMMLVKLLCNPKCLDVTPDTIKFQYRGALLNLFVIRRIWGGTGTESKYEETYTLYNIKSIEYLQSSFEKTFSCGHIRICADVNMGAKGKEERTFTIYGVKDFENTSAWMKEFVHLSNDT